MAQSLDQTVTANTKETQPENRAFYPALDGLRAVAFLMVFFQHYAGMAWGWTGVNLFFVLSGFLITGILFDTRNDLHRVRNFYVRRTLRIFPLYYGVMALLVLLYPVMHWQWSWAWLVWPAYLGNLVPFVHPYLPGSAMQHLADFQPSGSHGSFYTTLYLGHFWSLCVEEQFYVFWPWLVFWIRDRRKLLYLCSAMVPLSLALRIAGFHLLPAWMVSHGVLFGGTPFCLDSLFLGGAVALWLRSPHAAHLLHAARVALPLCLLTVVLAAIISPVGHVFMQPYVYPAGTWTWGLSLINLLATFIILYSLQPGSILYKILAARPLRWLGRISYGAYVLHDIPHLIYNFLGEVLFPSHQHLASILFALASTIGLAWLSFHFFESPFLNLKERWTIRD